MKTIKLLSALLLGTVLATVHPALGVSAFAATMTFTGSNAGYMFAGMFDPTGLTLPTQGVKAIGELIYSAKFVSPPWASFMDIELGIKAKKQLVILGHFNGLAGSVRTGCDTTPNPDSIANQEKTWDPAYVSDRFEDCYENLQSTFWKYMLANGIKKEDLTQSDYDTYVMNRISEYMNDDMMYRLIFFTDTAIASGGTNSLAAGQLKYFNMFDGVWKQLEAIVLATAARRTTITENAGANYAAQAFATPSPSVQPVTTYLDTLVYAATMELRSAQDQVLLVSQSVFDQYVRERKAVSNIDQAYTRVENGITKILFNGIEMIPVYTWDRLLKRHFDNGTKVLNPHRILYTTKSNIRVGTEETSNFSELNSEYSTYNKKWFADFGFNMDVKVVQDNLVQYGY